LIDWELAVGCNKGAGLSGLNDWSSPAYIIREKSVVSLQCYFTVGQKTHLEF